MTIIFIRCTIILLLLVLVMRLMGKRQIGEMQPYEFIITLLIAEVACVPMSDISIPLLYGIASIVAIFILHQILALLEQIGQKWKSVISGNPSILIDTNGINHSELRKNNLDVEDLIESLRATGHFSLDGVKYAILETNGTLSVVEAPNANDEGVLPVLLIDTGKVLPGNLSSAGIDPDSLNAFLKLKGIKSPKYVEAMTVDENGKVYLQEKKKKFSISQIKLQGEMK